MPDFSKAFPISRSTATVLKRRLRLDMSEFLPSEKNRLNQPFSQWDERRYLTNLGVDLIFNLGLFGSLTE